MMDGMSRKLAPNAADNNSYVNWCPELEVSYGVDGNLGTPGAANTACGQTPCDGFSCERPTDFCNDDGDAVRYTAESTSCQVSRFNNPYCDFQPTEIDCAADTEYCVSGVCEAVGNLPGPGDVIITELMGNPSAVRDDKGEYIELYNTTGQDLSLFTVSVEDDETGNYHSSFRVEDPAATIAAKGYAVLVTDTDGALNGGIEDAHLLADSPLKNTLSGSNLVIKLALRDGTVIDEAYYGVPSSGASQQLSLDAYTGGATNVAESNDSAASFCTAAQAYSSGDKGSPGADNEVCQ